MILDSKSPDPAWYPCRIFSANNLEFEHVTWCDTVTGVIQMADTTKGGSLQVVQTGKDEFKIKRTTIQVLAPLRIERITQ